MGHGVQKGEIFQVGGGIEAFEQGVQIEHSVREGERFDGAREMGRER